MDAGGDAASPADSGTDASALMCMPACDPDLQACCPGASGPECLDVNRDPSHCGDCTTNCFDTHRGNTCRFGLCMCNSVICMGTHDSFCCPPRAEGSIYYCADLDHTTTDCGECNRACDPTRADHCEGGTCLCGDERRQCDGTSQSRCCGIGAGAFGCVDTTSDINQCGQCGIGCLPGERCESSSCTRGASCTGGCTLGEICCDGSCCERSRCVGNVCI
jgi:hypothetical protein